LPHIIHKIYSSYLIYFILGSRISQLAVVDMLYVAYVQKNYDTCMNSLKKTFIAKTKNIKDKERGNDAGFKETDNRKAE
ncbi:hypothetical protein LIP93_14900, partial [Blautia hansenii]|nr:hypothetical protein [Blautia hansenii]